MMGDSVVKELYRLRNTYKKLSEIKDDEMLIVGDSIIDKESLLLDLKFYKDKEIWTTKQYKANIDAKDMLFNALEYEDSNMYENWYEDVLEDIREEDIRDLQVIVDRILNGSRNISYEKYKKVDFDIEC